MNKRRTNTTDKKLTREGWLLNAVDLERDVFKLLGYNVPKNINVSCSFCSKGNGEKNATLGECWTSETSADDKFNIFITPKIDDKWNVLDILTHEIVHATVGIKQGHNKVFRKCATAVGLEGKMTCTEGKEKYKKLHAEVFKLLPDYPHGKLTGSTNDKKQSTRLVKIMCENEDCESQSHTAHGKKLNGYTLRGTRVWISKYGCPKCPACDEEMLPQLPPSKREILEKEE